MPVELIPYRFKDTIFRYVPEHEFPKLYKEHMIAYVLAGVETDESGVKWIPCLTRGKTLDYTCVKCGNRRASGSFLRIDKRIKKFLSALEMAEHGEFPPNLCVECFEKVVKSTLLEPTEGS